MGDWPVEWFDDIDSTNEEARRRVSAGSFQNVWIAARSQSSGRGRLGRNWKSPIGNLFATALFEFSGTLNDAAKIPFVSALAVADTFDVFAPKHKVEVKWPNDVRCNGAKVSGILIEAGPLDNSSWVAVGIGINVAVAPQDVGQATASIASLRGDEVVTAQIAMEELRNSFSMRMNALSHGFENTRKAWLERAEGLGKTVTVTCGNEVLKGTFEALGDDGELHLRLPDGQLVVITAGDVELIKERAL